MTQVTEHAQDVTKRIIVRIMEIVLRAYTDSHTMMLSKCYRCQKLFVAHSNIMLILFPVQQKTEMSIGGAIVVMKQNGFIPCQSLNSCQTKCPPI